MISKIFHNWLEKRVQIFPHQSLKREKVVLYYVYTNRFFSKKFILICVYGKWQPLCVKTHSKDHLALGWKPAKKKFTPCKLRYICMYVVLCSNTLLLRVCLHFSAACCYFSLLLLAKTTKQNWNFLLNEIFLCWELKYIITRHRNNNIGNFIETIPTFKMYCMCSMLFLVTLFRQSLVICNVLT